MKSGKKGGKGSGSSRGGKSARPRHPMDDVDEGLLLTPDELELLNATLDARLQDLLPTEDDDARAICRATTREGFVAAYRDGQRRVLRAARDEVQGMLAGAASEADEE